MNFKKYNLLPSKSLGYVLIVLALHSYNQIVLAISIFSSSEEELFRHDSDSNQVFKYKTPLDHENNVRLEWNVKLNDANPELSLIRFKLTIIEKNPLVSSFYFGFGMSDRGEFINADVCIFEIKSGHLIEKIDAHTNSYGTLLKDNNNKNDYKQIEFKNKLPNIYEIIFERKLNTCDSNDYLIESGTVHLIYFKTYSKKFEKIIDLLDGYFRPSEQSDIAEMKQAQLIKSTYFDSLITQFDETKSKYFDVLNDNVNIPSDETTYWCKVYKLDQIFVDKHHIIAFEGMITPSSQGIVHHMELFYCMYDPPNERMKKFSGPCKSEEKPEGLKQCRKVIAAWAMGASRFVYPDKVGGILGGLDHPSPYLVLEIHYDNPNKRSNIVDSSGVRIFYQGPGSSQKLRKYDAGIMEIGLEYNAKNAIPPRTREFHLNGFCLSECTKYGLDNRSGGITVFASQLHTHLTGRRVWTSLIRNGRVVQILNSDNHYDQMFQEIRLLKKPVRVRLGDALINTCVYDTRDRKNMTVGGYSIRDEMCVNYVHYYPLSKLEVCKSSLSDHILTRFFQKMNYYDEADTNQNKSIVENFNSIRWTRLTKSILSDLYDTAPISLSCNSSDGKHISQTYYNDGKAKKYPKEYFSSIISQIENLRTDRAPLDTDLVGDCSRNNEQENNSSE